MLIFRGGLGLGSDIGFPNVALTSDLIPSPPITETVKLHVSRGPGKADLGWPVAEEPQELKHSFQRG